MKKNNPLSVNQRIIQTCLFILGAISLLGASLQLYLGQPTSPSADNIHRFMAGIYFSMGPLLIWTAITIRKHNHLIFFLAFTALMAGIGRLISMSAVGLPGDRFIIYLIPELTLPFIMIGLQIGLNRKIRNMNE